jgi:tRNA threonylcarbamoyladenosine biosynthesis protein TsaB
MAGILLIETSTQVCSVALCADGKVLSIRESHDQKSHSELITTFIEEVLKDVGIEFDQLDAVAVSKGPGSYTGLRIGVSTAKGICYAIEKPLLAIDTLEAMTSGFRDKFINKISQNDLFCPMIDARRMEVYAAVFNAECELLQPTEAIIIDEKSFNNLLEEHRIWFFGDGAQKCNSVFSSHKNAIIVEDFFPSAAFMTNLAEVQFLHGKFAELAYFEPFYLKEFIAGLPKVKGLYA